MTDHRDTPDGSERPPAAASNVLIPQRLHAAIRRVIEETRGFNERKQEWWCRICSYKETFRTTLHAPGCPIYELHGAWEDTVTLKEPASPVLSMTEQEDDDQARMDRQCASTDSRTASTNEKGCER